MDSSPSSVVNLEKKRRPFKKFLVIVLICILVFLSMAYFIAGLSYSDGTRSGILTKVSRKGYIFKTYEGELNIGGIDQGDGTIMPLTIFKFSVKDKETYLALDSLQGKKIIVHYNQVMKNFFWQGESDYFVYKVKRIPK